MTTNKHLFNQLAKIQRLFHRSLWYTGLIHPYVLSQQMPNFMNRRLEPRAAIYIVPGIIKVLQIHNNHTVLCDAQEFRLGRLANRIKCSHVSRDNLKPQIICLHKLNTKMCTIELEYLPSSLLLFLGNRIQ